MESKLSLSTARGSEDVPRRAAGDVPNSSRRRPAHPAKFRDRAFRTVGGVQGRRAPREILGVSRAGVAQDERAQIRDRRRRIGADAARVRDSVLGHLGGVRPRGAKPRFLDRVTDRADRRGLRCGVGQRGRLVVGLRHRDGRRIGDPGPTLVGPAGARERRGIRERGTQIVRVERVRGHDPDRATDDRADPHMRLVGDRVLVDRASRIARDRGASAVHVDVRLVGRDTLQCVAEWRKEQIGTA